MFKELFSLLNEKSELEVDRFGEPTGEDLRLATAVVLWEVCAADDRVSTIEAQRIADLLDQQFRLDEEEYQRVSSISNILSDNATIERCISLINQKFSKEQRQKILELARAVACADQSLSPAEALVCDMIKHRLGL